MAMCFFLVGKVGMEGGKNRWGVKIVEPAEGRLGSSRLEDLAAGGGQVPIRVKRA